MDEYDIIADLEREVEQQTALLESLTPGGSEFHNSPENCARWIRERLASVVKQVEKRKEAETLLARLTKSLCNCNCSFLPTNTLAIDPEKHHENCVYRRAAINTYVYTNGREAVEENE